MIAELIEEHKTARLFRDMEELRENSGFVPLDEI